MMGAESYGKFNRLLWVGQLAAIWLTLGSMVFQKAGMALKHGGIFTGFSMESFKSNLAPPYLLFKIMFIHV